MSLLTAQKREPHAPRSGSDESRLDRPNDRNMSARAQSVEMHTLLAEKDGGQKPVDVADAQMSVHPAPVLQLNETPKVTGYVGINVGAEKELGALKNSMKRLKNHTVVGVLDDPKLEGESGLDKVDDYKSKGIDIYKTGHEALLVEHCIGVPTTHANFQNLVKWLGSFDDATRDTIAGIARLFWDAERGAFSLERLVLSGHSDKEILWGEAKSSGGYEFLPTLQTIARFFSNAALQVEDIMISACFCFSPVLVRNLIQHFPNLHTVWAYQGFSPSAKSGGSLRDLARWEKTTRGGAQKPVESRRSGSAKIWSKDSGGLPPAPPLDKFLERANKWISSKYEAQFNGSAYDYDELVAFYQVVQVIVGHPDLPDSERPQWGRRRDVVLRLRKWNALPYFFAENNLALVQRVYGQDAIKKYFDYIPRKDMLGFIGKLENRVGAVEAGTETLPNGVAKAGWLQDARRLLGLLRGGLWQLDKKIIPSRWCI